MEKTKKIFCLLLCMFLLAPGLAACGESESNPSPSMSDTDPSETTETAQPETDPREQSDNLPEKNFDGEVFTLYLYTSAASPDFMADEYTGEAINDSVFERNMNISSRFNMKFEYSLDDSFYSTWDTNAIVAVRAGDDTNDLLGMSGGHVFYHAKSGALLDWNEYTAYNDFTKPWWDSDFYEEMTLGGKLFGMTGSISHKGIGGTFCLLFNKDIMDRFSMEYPYESVRNGSWTFDQFYTVGTAVVEDLNGDGTTSPEHDRMALDSNSWRFPVGSFYMAGDKIITTDKNEAPQLTIYNERTDSIIERMTALYDEPGFYINDYHSVAVDTWHAGRALFTATAIQQLAWDRGSEFEMGVVPYPKYDESVSRYYSLADAGELAYALPKTVKNLEFTSIITEALAAEGYKHIIPEYFEVCLQSKYARDEESADMLDLILETRFFDYGYWDSAINWTISYPGRNILFVDQDFTSFYETHKNATETALQQLYESYLNNTAE